MLSEAFGRINYVLKYLVLNFEKKLAKMKISLLRIAYKILSSIKNFNFSINIYLVFISFIVRYLFKTVKFNIL